jgi:hypothetical protein
MSIISDALKKAQSKRGQGAKTPPLADTLPVEKATPKPRNHRLRIVHISVILACIIAMVFIFGPTKEIMTYLNARFYALRQQPAGTVERTDVGGGNVATAIAPARVQATQPVPSRSSGAFNLSGIVFGAGEPFAVIDNQIVVEGDAVSGWKVITIEQNRVMLLSGNEQLTLTLK